MGQIIFNQGRQGFAGTLMALLSLTLLFVSAVSMVKADAGLDWLAAQSQADGSIALDSGTATAYQSTSETLRTFRLFNQSASIDQAAALQFLDTESDLNSEYQARNIIAKVDAGYTVTDLVYALKNQADSQGGFGESAGFDVTVLDTAMVLEALSYASLADDAIALDAINILLARQDGNGGWYDNDNESSVYLTAITARALQPFANQYTEVSQSLSAARNFLLSRADAFGAWPSDMESAQALLTLATVVSDRSAISVSAAALTAQQASNGSWSDDVYVTAIALRALWVYQAKNGNEGATGSGSLTGHVLKAGTGEPIAGAQVSLASASGNTVLTDTEGYFVISGIAEGEQTVLAEKAGYSSTSAIVRLYSDQTSTAGELILGLNTYTAIVSGHIIDDLNLSGIEGVSVSLSGINNYAVTTDAQGYFELLTVSPDAYALSIFKDSYYAVSGNALVAASQNLTINHRLIKEGAFVNSNPADLSGLVIDAVTRQPLTGALFSLDNGINISTDSEGRFLAANVARDSYQATLSLNGYASLTLSIQFPAGANGDMGTLPMYPLNGSTAADSLTLFGHVVDGVTNEPIAAAVIERLDTGETWTADAEGRFTLLNLNELDFQLSMSATDYETRSFALSASGFGEIQQQFVLPPLGANPNATTSTLTGVITDKSTGLVISGVQLAIAGTSLSTISDSNGVFQLSGIDPLEFSITASAVDYLSSMRQLQLSSHDDYQLNLELEPALGDGENLFQIISLSEPQTATPANAQMLFDARIANLSTLEQDALIIGEIYNANGESVATVSPYANGTQALQSLFNFLPEQTIELTIPWETLQHPAGTYRLVLRLIQPDTISQSLPSGVVYTEQDSIGDIVEAAAIAGTLSLNPPLTQAGAQTPVSLDALVLNKGNTSLEGARLTLTITDPVTGTTLHSATTQMIQPESTNFELVSFGDWVAETEGNLDIAITADDPAVKGLISGQLYVGDKASGAFTLDQEIVAEGTHTVHASINLEGVDTASGTVTDPLFFAVQEAIKTGSDYTGSKTLDWQRSNRCLGCHVQAQGLVGSASAYQQNLGDEFKAISLYNTLASSQQDDGGLRISHSNYTRTQTTLGVWALTAWDDIKTSFRTVYQASNHLYDKRVQSGNQTWWQPDQVTGWWYSNESHTAMTVKAYVKLLQGAEQIDLGNIRDYQLPQYADLGSGSSPLDITMSPDGLLYTVKATGDIVRTDLQTGITETVDKLPIQAYGIAIDSDGSLYVSGYGGKLLRRNPDGSIETLLTGSGYLTDVEIGPDGLLYVADHSQNRILRVTLDGQTEVLASGGLLSRPYGMTFGNDGQLYIANRDNFNILKLDMDGQLSIFADGLAYPPLYISPDPSGGFYFTSHILSSYRQFAPSAINHLSDKGVIERLHSGSQLYGVVVSDDGRILSADLSEDRLYELTETALDTSLLVNYREQVSRAANYFLARYQDGTSDNIVQAMRLMGLAEARKVTTEATLNTQIDEAIATIANTLSTRQLSDGGWGRYTSNSSDTMVTALVGLSLDYTNPSTDDPVVRKTITYLLNKQQADYSWHSDNGILSTNLAATGLVVSYLPVALERLGGIDVTLSLNFPANISLSNPTLAADTQQTQANSSSDYDWQLQGVTSESRVLEFDLTFDAMQLDEVRAAANDAYIAFANSFSGEVLQIDLSVPELTAKSETGLVISTDKSIYAANETVIIPVTVANTGPTAIETTVRLSIGTLDINDSLATLPTFAVGELDANAEIQLGSDWNTGITLTGTYQVTAQLLDTEGRILDEAVTLFEIESVDSLLEASFTTDKAIYQAWDQVNITSRVANITHNAIQAPSLVEISVRDPDGSVIFTDSAQLGELLPEKLRDLPFTLILVDAKSGDYLIEMVVKDDFSHQVLGTAAQSFQVERNELQAIAAQVTATPTQVYQGDPVQCTETLSNISASALEGVLLTRQLLKMDSEAVISESEQGISLAATQTVVETRTIATGSLPVGAYACVLTAGLDGQSQTLGAAGFDVLEPPIRLDVQFNSGMPGRLLILLDDAALPPDGKDPHGAVAEPDLLQQRVYLENTLNDAGWSYTIVTDKDDFARELNSGTYTLYALFAEQEKLDEQVQRQLRDAIYKGDGLLQAGDHDQRYNELDAVLGTVIKGKHSSVSGLEFIDSELPLTGMTDWHPDDKPLRAELTGAEDIAHYLGLDAAPADSLAVARHAYGEGRSVFIGFDLLLHAATEGADTLYGELLLAALDDIRPETLALTAGSAIPMQLQISNLGIATPGQAILTLPAGSEVLDSGTAGINPDGTLSWPFELAEEAAVELTVWLRLPEAAGEVTLSTLIQVGTEEPLQDHETLSFSLLTQPEISLSEVIALLEAQAPVNDYRPALTAINKALDESEQGQPGKALQFLLQASDSLIRIDTEQAAAVRQQLTLLIAAIAREV